MARHSGEEEGGAILTKVINTKAYFLVVVLAFIWYRNDDLTNIHCGRCGGFAFSEPLGPKMPSAIRISLYVVPQSLRRLATVIWRKSLVVGLPMITSSCQAVVVALWTPSAEYLVFWLFAVLVVKTVPK